MVEGFWKTRDNGGKAAWLFIGVLSSVYWISDVITGDELAVLIICACSSRNLFIKHHFVFERPQVVFYCNFSCSRHVSKTANLIGWIVFDAARQTKKTKPRRFFLK